MERLVMFNEEYAYSSLCCLRIVAEDEWQKVQSFIGRDVHLGEVAGKHSHVVWELEDGDITILTEDPVEMAVFKKWCPNGYFGNCDIVGTLLDQLRDEERNG
jgi:hypothetical protein